MSNSNPTIKDVSMSSWFKVVGEPRIEHRVAPYYITLEQPDGEIKSLHYAAYELGTDLLIAKSLQMFKLIQTIQPLIDSYIVITNNTEDEDWKKHISSIIIPPEKPDDKTSA